MILSKIKSKISGFLENCMIYGVRETIKSAVRMRIEKIKSILFGESLSYPSSENLANKSTINNNIIWKLKYLDYTDNNEGRKFRFNWRERQGI